MYNLILQMQKEKLPFQKGSLTLAVRIGWVSLHPLKAYIRAQLPDSRSLTCVARYSQLCYTVFAVTGFGDTLSRSSHAWFIRRLLGGGRS